MKRRNIVIIIIMILFLSIIIGSSFLNGFFSKEFADNGFDFVDSGIEGNKSSDWYFVKSLKTTPTDKGTVLVNNGGGNAFYSANKPSTSMNNDDELFDWDAPYTVEFDLVSGNDSAIQIIDKKNSTSRTFEQLGATSNTHVKLVNDGNEVKYYINGINDPIYTYDGASLNHTAVRFVIPQSSNLTYKNFTINLN